LSVYREERSEFIRAKYIEKKFAIKTSTDIRDLHSDVEHALNNKDIHQLLQAYVEGADFSKPFIDSVGISFYFIFFLFLRPP
jgi:Arf-GAP/SH3 domain/ANK repeat/PH domain-containing protein